jgi:hypothetical protein
MGEGTVIAVVDTGIDPDHPDMADNLWSNPGEIAGNGIDDDLNGFVDDTWGWDFVGGDADPKDTYGHGTHVAGIAAAVGDNATGILGVAPRAQVMAVRALTDRPAQSSDVIAALLYAAENGADVITNSWGTRALPGGTLDDAVETALALGSVVVFAGGNGGLVFSAIPWWRHPDAINVAMTYPPSGSSAFSATDADLAAPGRRILSLRSRPGTINDIPVGDDYVVASGTSAAAPHVAGAAALLVSVFPGLTPSEVEWHLEAAAIQPGATGWEGLPWNPDWGWGHLDLDGIFDPVPVTTRLDRHAIFERHQYVGEVSAPSRVSHVYTTHDPIAWSVLTPAWLQAAPASGVGDDAVDLSVDSGAVGVGVHEDSYQLSAPSSDDGGASLPVRLYAYPDLGLASAAEIQSLDRNTSSISSVIIGPTMAGSPTHSMVAWHAHQSQETWTAVIRRDGSVAGPFLLTSGMYGQEIDSAFDGRHFAVLWFDWDERRDHLLLSRLALDGTPIDATPREIWRPSGKWWTTPQIAFDGRSYIILWTQVSSNDAGRTSRLVMLRMGADFALERKLRYIYKGNIGGSTTNAASVRLACGDGHCLAVWRDYDAGGSSNHIVGLRFVDGEPQGAPFEIFADGGMRLPKVATSGSDYLVIVSERSESPCGPTRRYWCVKGVLGMRVSGNGQVLDAAPTEFITAPADSPVGITLGRIGFDGEAYTLPYALTSRCTNGICESAALVTRVSTTGEVLDVGGPITAMLVDSGSDNGQMAVTGGAHGTTVTWLARERDPVSNQLEHVILKARPMASHSAETLPTLTLGSMGSISLEEGQRWAVKLVAPGLDPQQVSCSAQGLPTGAVLEASSGVLHWKPTATEAGTYAGIRLVADDGSQQLEETVSIVVSNTTSSISGVVRQPDGAPVAGAVVQLAGTKPKRETRAEGDGSFAFFDLDPRRYRLRLGRPTKKSWRARTVKVELAGATDDMSGVDIVATPR